MAAHMHHHHRRASVHAPALQERTVRDLSFFDNPFSNGPSTGPSGNNPSDSSNNSGFAQAAAAAASTKATLTAKPRTVYETVYYTQSATFSGPVSYVTLSNQPASTQAPSSVNSNTVVQPSSELWVTQGSYSSSAQDTQAASSDPGPSTVLTTSTGDPVTLTSSAPSSLLAASSVAASASASARGPEIAGGNTSTGTNTAASSTASPSIPDPTDTSNGLTTGAKAGIAFVVILGVAGIAALIAFFILKKKRQEREAYQRTADEKSGFASATTPASTAGAAPRLSLRPLTQFGSAFGNRKSGNPLSTATTGAAAGAAAGAAGGIAMRETNNANANRNPFGDHAAVNKGPTGMRPAGAGVFKINTDDHADGPENPAASPPANGGPNANLGDIAGAAVGGAAAGVTAKKAINGPGSPTNENKFGDQNANDDAKVISPSEVGPMAAAGFVGPGPNGPPVLNVHRVQLDFKPSMADELELQTGQLVRMVKEYDDGWALCTRLGSSEQGVCPRTCLSQRPVKPRPPPGHINTNIGNRGPGGPMRGPGGQISPYTGSPNGSRQQSPMYPPGRPMTPNGQHPRPMSPDGYGPRPASPANSYRPMPGPRPASPAGSHGRPRSPSASQMNGQGWVNPGPSRMGPGPIPMPMPSAQPGSRAAVARKPIGSAPSGSNSPENPSILVNGEPPAV